MRDWQKLGGRVGSAKAGSQRGEYVRAESDPDQCDDGPLPDRGPSVYSMFWRTRPLS